MIAYVVCLLLLAVLAAEDIKEKKISIGIMLTALGFGLGYRIVFGAFYWKDIIADLLPGTVLILLSFLTKESIGYGDGLLVMILGLWMGMWSAMAITGTGMILAGLYGGFLLMKRKKDLIPFVPFLLMGMEVFLIYA